MIENKDPDVAQAESEINWLVGKLLDAGKVVSGEFIVEVYERRLAYLREQRRTRVRGRKHGEGC